MLRGIAAVILVSGWLTAAVVLAQASNPHDADSGEYMIVGNHVFPITLAESKHDRLFLAFIAIQYALGRAAAQVGAVLAL
jgi:hypothetical protein